MGGEALTLPKDLLDFSGYGPKELQALLDLAEEGVAPLRGPALLRAKSA